MSRAWPIAQIELASMKIEKALEKLILWRGRYLEPNIDDQYGRSSRNIRLLTGSLSSTLAHCHEVVWTI